MIAREQRWRRERLGAMIEQIVIGVDGGGTRLRAAVATDAGELLGSRRGWFRKLS